MKTLTKTYAKRGLSLLLVAVTLLSLSLVGLTSAFAANTQLAETGWATSDTFHCLHNDHWNSSNDTKMTWDSGGNHCERKFTGVSTTGNFYFRFYCESNSTTLGAYDGADTDNDGNVLIEANDLTYGGYYTYVTNTTGYSKNWQINLSNYNQYDSVDITVRFFCEYGGKNNVMYVSVTNGKHATTISSVTVSASAEGAGAVGDDVTLTADATVTNPSGNTIYDFYVKAPGESSYTNKQSDTSKTYTFTPTVSGEYSYYVKATNNGKSGESDKKTFTVNPAYSVSASLSESTVYAGQDITVTANTNLANPTFTLKDSAGSPVSDSNDTGIFTIPTADLAAGDYTYTVTATGISNGKEYTASTTVSFTVNVFSKLNITTSYPESVECGSSINISSSANTSETVTYTLTRGGATVGTNTTGSFTVATSTADKDTEISFTLTATVTVNGEVYTDSKTFTVSVTPISNTTDITIYFKSSSTYGYNPVATVKGVYETVSGAMTKSTFIRTNETDTADYWWYKVTTKVSSANPTVSFNVKSGRYAMEATTSLTLTSGVTEYYFGVDNLNCGTELVNLTNESEDIRNFCESAVHMVYDPEYDGEATLAAVAATYNLTLNGDVNGDGKVNVRDATLLQKSLANAAELSATAQKVADFNLDGNVSIKDATAIQKQVAKL